MEVGTIIYYEVAINKAVNIMLWLVSKMKVEY